MLVAESETKVCNNVLVEKGKFIIKIAESNDEILQAKKLRYRVFKAEQGRLDVVTSDIDEDIYDAQFTHLLVVDTENQRVVGTYRMQSGITAKQNLGFYSESEYDIVGLDQIADKTWEVGRSCVDPDYRSGAVIALLWAGINAMQQIENFQYLMGCVSLEPNIPEVGWAMYEQFSTNGDIIERPFGHAKPSYVLPCDNPRRRAEFVMYPETLKPHFPPLLKGYLRLGAKIAGEPTFDREFGSIDFLILFDFKQIEAKYAKHFIK